MTSHYYLQRTELRSTRHSKNWTHYAAEKNAMMSTVGAPAEYNNLSIGEVEAAYTSIRMMRNSVLEHERRAIERIHRETESKDSETE